MNLPSSHSERIVTGQAPGPAGAPLLTPLSSLPFQSIPQQPMRVLLVEDDAVLADGIARVLKGHGMAVDVVHNGSDADALIQTTAFSAMVLDIGLPGGIDGFEVVRRLRARHNQLPVLLLTARDAIQDRVHGLETGADDYLVKPFATPELVARLKALMRRGGAAAGRGLQLGRLSADIMSRQAEIDGRRLDLSPREWAVLEYLLLNSTRIVSKQQIIDTILPWGEKLTPNAVEVYVSRIRLKIADAGVRIRTIRGFGYMLEEAPE
jgi:DNA-binding response OmpR family regulator